MTLLRDVNSNSFSNFLFCANHQGTLKYIRALSLSYKFPSHLCTKNALKYSLCLTGLLTNEGQQASPLFEHCHLKQTP
jgi:hypothetical protein